MKNLLLLMAIFLTACSDNSPKNPPSPTEEVYNIDVNGIGFFSGSPLAESESRVDLLTVYQGQRKSLSVTIKNMSSTATPLFTASLNNSNFYITSSTCINKSLPPSGGSCSLTLNFSAVGKSPQPFEANLNFGPSTIQVWIEVLASSGQGGGGGSASIKMYDSSTLISSPPDYSIGSVSGTAKISKVITIKNEGTSATLVSDATLSSSDFYLSSNGCAAKTLAVNASCSVTVNFSGTGKSAGSKSTNLSFGGTQVSLSALVTAPPAPAPAQLVFMEGANNLSQDYFLGSFSTNLTLSKTFSVKNIGGSASSTLSLELLNNSSGWYAISNSCVNKALAAGASCSFSLRVSTTGKSAGTHSVSLRMDQSSQVVYFERSVPNYLLSLNLSGPGSVIIDSNSYGSSQSLSLQGNQSIGVTLVPADNATAQSGGLTCVDNDCSIVLDSDKSVSILFTCNSGYTEDNGSCISDNSLSPGASLAWSDNNSDGMYIWRLDGLAGVQKYIWIDGEPVLEDSENEGTGSYVYALGNLIAGEYTFFGIYNDDAGDYEFYMTDGINPPVYQRSLYTGESLIDPNFVHDLGNGTYVARIENEIYTFSSSGMSFLDNSDDPGILYNGKVYYKTSSGTEIKVYDGVSISSFAVNNPHGYEYMSQGFVHDEELYFLQRESGPRGIVNVIKKYNSSGISTVDNSDQFGGGGIGAFTWFRGELYYTVSSYGENVSDPNINKLKKINLNKTVETVYTCPSDCQSLAASMSWNSPSELVFVEFLDLKNPSRQGFRIKRITSSGQILTIFNSPDDGVHTNIASIWRANNVMYMNWSHWSDSAGGYIDSLGYPLNPNNFESIYEIPQGTNLSSWFAFQGQFFYVIYTTNNNSWSIYRHNGYQTILVAENLSEVGYFQKYKGRMVSVNGNGHGIIIHDDFSYHLISGNGFWFNND